MIAPFIPYRLTAERERQRRTVTAIAKTLGVSRQTIHNWESGATQPSPEDTNRLAKALDIDPAWLYTPRRVNDDLRAAFYTSERQP